MKTSTPINIKQTSVDTLVQKYREVRAIKDKELGLVTEQLDGKGNAVGYTRVSTHMQKKKEKVWKHRRQK